MICQITRFLANFVTINLKRSPMLKIDIRHTGKWVSQAEIENYKSAFLKAYNMVYQKTGAGNEFLGWVNLPLEAEESIIKSIENDVLKLKDKTDVFVVIGIGGSYLGARAVVDALSNEFALKAGQKPQIIYAGHNLSQDYHARLLKYLDTRNYAVAVISKSGTTTEPAVAFRLLKTHLENKYGKSAARERIIAVTDKAKGALKGLADKEGYKSYVIPDDVGGRYSVLTPVGLLPVAMAGFDIRELLRGAADMARLTATELDIYKNPAALYAIVRNILYTKGKTTEILAAYEPQLNYLTEWWKQLYGESEGKEHKGIFPAGVTFTSDLHSMGQYIQEGGRHIFETTLDIGSPGEALQVPFDPENTDGLNFIARKDLDHINKMAALGTRLAHVDGGVPNISIMLEKIDAYHLGQLIYFFEIGCAFSGYMLGVNPFDQPGVEAYKKNMFALLGKPGFESETERLRKMIEG